MYFGTGVVLNSNEIEYMNIYARGWKGVENDFIFWKKGKILDLFVWIRFVFSFSKAFYEYLNSFTLFLAVRIGISCIEVNEWKKKKTFWIMSKSPFEFSLSEFVYKFTDGPYTLITSIFFCSN